MLRKVPAQTHSSASLNAGSPTFARRQLPLLIGLTVGIMAATPAAANPQGGQVVNGAATFSRPDATTLEVTNTPNAIINWQQFNIGANETTRFIQQSASSAVMNRVVGLNPSEILGQLQSNGQVYLINPNGIVFGQGAVIDTAAFIGATLNMTDADFLAGRHKFEGPDGAGSIVNHGVIKARDDGGVYLVAPEIENDGIIRTDEGQILLAAGRKLTISSLDVAHISFEVQAPADSVVNLGELLTAGGAASVFAGSIHNAGSIRASGISRDASGRIVLNASPTGSIKLAETSEVVATRGDSGGSIAIDGGQTLAVAGKVSAVGAAGTGGRIDMSADTVTVDNAVVDASGDTGGGRIRIGGEYQGGKHLHEDEMRNAVNLTITATGEVRADATGRDGDGGEVIVWSDQVTGFLGEIYARPGEASGAGGSVEVSGHEFLMFRGDVDSGRGDRHGRLLLDPKDLVIAIGGGDNPANATFGTNANGTFTIDPTVLSGLLGSQNVTLQANNDISVNNTVSFGGPANSLTMQAGRSVNINATMNFAAANNITITANERVVAGVVDAERDAGAGGITMAPGTSLNTIGNVRLIVEDDPGKTNNTSGNMVLADITAQDVELLMLGSTDDSDIVSLPGTFIAANSVFVDHFPNAGGAAGSNGDIGTVAQPLRVNANAFAGHLHHAGIVNVELLNDGQTTLGDTFFGIGKGITGIETGSDQGGGDVSITSIGNLEVVDDIRVRGGNLILEAGSDGTGSLTVDMDSAVNLGAGAVATTPDVVDVVVGTTAGDSGTMTILTGEGVSLIGADGTGSEVNFDVFGSGTQTFSVGTDLELLPGNGGGTSTFNIRSGRGGTGGNGGGLQTFNVASDLRVSSPAGDNPLNVELSATNARQLFQIGETVTFAAGTGSNSIIEVFAGGSATGGPQQDFQVNFGLAGTGQFTIDTGIAGNPGGVDNRVSVSSNGVQSVDLRGAASGLAIKGDSTTADPANFFASLDSASDQIIAVEGNGNLFMAAGQVPALLTAGGQQSITVTNGGVNIQPLAGADKETRIEGATQAISADFMQVFGGDSAASATATVRSTTGNQTINITTAGGQSFFMRGGIGGSAGSASLDAAGVQTISNPLGAVIIGDGTQRASALLLSSALNLSGQSIAFSGGSGFNAVARATTSGNAVLNSTSTIDLSAGSGSFGQATVNASGDLDVQAGTGISVSGGNNVAASATFSGNTISRFDAASLTVVAGTTTGSGNAIVSASGGALTSTVSGNVSLTGGGLGTSSTRARIDAQSNLNASFGSLSMTAGAGSDADARLEALTGTLNLVTTGNVNLDASTGGLTSEVNVEGATGLVANISGTLTLTGGGSQDAAADMGAASGTADITSGAITLSAGSGQDSVASIFGDTVRLDITGGLLLNAGIGTGAGVGVAGPVVRIDATANVTLNAGGGSNAFAGIGDIAGGTDVVIGDTAPIGGNVNVNSGAGTGARAFVGTNCVSGPCNATVSIDTAGTLGLLGPTVTGVVGSRTALTGDTGGSVSLNAVGAVSLSNQSVNTRGSVSIAGATVSQTPGGTLGGIHAQSLNVTSVGAIDLQNTINDVASASFTTTGSGPVMYTNDATVDAINGLSFALTSASIADGDFLLNSTGATAINGAVAPLGLSGNVTILTAPDSPLTINAPISGRSGVILAAMAGGTADNVTVNAAIDSFVGSVTITADDEVSIQAPIDATTSSINVSSTNGSIEGPGLLSAPTVALLAPAGSVGEFGTVFIEALGVSLDASNTLNVDVVNNPSLDLPGLSLGGDLFITSDGTINQLGPINVAGDTTLTSFFGDVNLTDGGNTFGGGLSASALDARNSVSVAGTGTLTLNGGFLTASTNYTGFTQVVNNGELDLPDGAVFNAGGNFINNGVIRFGNSPGTLTVTGNMTLSPTSVLEIELSDIDADLDGFPDNDLLIVTGTLTLGGELEIQPIDGFVGDPDVEFDIVQCGTCIGAFDLLSAFPAILTVEVVDDPSLTSFVTIVTTPSDDSLDPTSDILADLDSLDELEALEEELLEAELEVALEDDGEDEDDEDEDGPSGALICL